ncbi:hypothetical protein Xtri_13340 [Xanthomonas campestris pv. trichodesmae]|uniref:Uncharacterized protein n=2 Tax=Xanthomonas citri TaxID=346 RepID=A0AB33CL03_XANCI|nr:hypothetical protein XcvCFBP7111P_15250 [Xanthomonas citri pv. vignicola]MBZ3920394.1 hypothetical protein [Xanthomonas campestris pv. trichodesmae]MBZ3923837.1 hypothetical protein [Xanthomonas citri pv. sesbaniae]
MQPVLASDLVFGYPRELFRVTPAGDVVVSEGVSTTDAARAFWEAVAQTRPRPHAAVLSQPSGNFGQLQQPSAAAQPAQGGTVTGWRMIDGMTVFDVASHSGIVEPQQFVRYADYLAARQPVGVGPVAVVTTSDHFTYGKLNRDLPDGAPLYTAPPAPAAVPVDGEGSVIEALLELAYAAWCLADDAQDNGETLTVDRAGFDKLSECLDKLDALPDDQPGYIMEVAAKARWALRRLLATHQQPAVAKEPASFRFIAEEDRAPTRHDMRDRGSVGYQHKPSPTDEGAKG